MPTHRVGRCTSVAMTGKGYRPFQYRKLLEDIPNKVRDAMGIIVGVNLLEADGREYIEIDVPAYPIGISCKGVYYYRSESTWQILTGPALEAFLMRKRGATWDNLPLPAFSLEGVDDEIVVCFKGTSKNSRLVIRREILSRIEVRKVREYFVYFKLFAQ